MLKIRLQRVGRKHEPAFRLVLTDSKNSTKSGKFKDILGSYDPRKSSDTFKPERIKHWLSVGAQPTGTVHNLLVKHGIIEGKKVNVLPKKTPPVKEASAEEADAAPKSEVSTEEATAEETSSESPAPTPEPAQEPRAEEPAPEAQAETPVETPTEKTQEPKAPENPETPDEA